MCSIFRQREQLKTSDVAVLRERANKSDLNTFEHTILDQGLLKLGHENGSRKHKMGYRDCGKSSSKEQTQAETTF